MHNYYSAFSKEYLHKGLVLYQSMKKHDKDFTFFFICLDDGTKLLMDELNYDRLIAIDIKDLERYDKEVAEVRSKREDKTYAWLIKAAAPFYIFDLYPELEHLLWVDGDTEFLSDPKPIYEEWGESSILLSEEKFTGEYRELSELYGYYNAGLIGFKRDPVGLAALSYYRNKLIECNFDEYKGSWNDQLYITDWPQRFGSIAVIKNIGINLTPFINYYRCFKEKGWVINRRDDGIYINDHKIVLYHCMAFRYFDGIDFDLSSYAMDFEPETIKHIYIPYMMKCREAYRIINTFRKDFAQSTSTKGRQITNYFNLPANDGEPIENYFVVVDRHNIKKLFKLHVELQTRFKDFNLWVCCMDDYSFEHLSARKLPQTISIDIKSVIHRNSLIWKAPKDKKQLEVVDRLIEAVSSYILKNNYNVVELKYEGFYTTKN